MQKKNSAALGHSLIIPPVMLVVSGENIADILPDGRPVPGGAALNVARALGRLGAETAYLTPVSGDENGRLLRRALQADGVRILPEQPSPKPCSLARVSVDENGQPAYAFSRDGAADADFQFSDIPPLPETAAVLHLVGALALDSAAGPAFEKIVRAAVGLNIPVCADPNIRPSLINNEKTLRGRLQRVFGMAGVVKLSDEDAAFLFPENPESAFAALLAAGAGMVVMTRGAQGAEVRTSRVSAAVPTPTIQAADTVGAGDCFAAALLFFLHRNGILRQCADGDGEADSLRSALNFAAAAAAVNCGRPGCDPPTLAEIPVAPDG